MIPRTNKQEQPHHWIQDKHANVFKKEILEFFDGSVGWGSGVLSPQQPGSLRW